VSNEARVNLIFDPYRISMSEGERVRDVSGELKAFHEIGHLLKRDSRYGTVHPKSYVIETSWEHFRTYRALNGVRLELVNPRARIRERLSADPPEWLTDQMIADCKLLESSVLATSLVEDDWAATVGSCVFPGVAEAASLEQWLTRVALAPTLPACCSCEPVMEWLASRFVTLARRTIPSPDIVFEMRDALKTAPSPAALVTEWIRRRSLLPLTRPDIYKPLIAPELPPEQPRNLVHTGYLPQLFPLPESLHADVSHIMRRAVQRSRLKNPDSFEAVVLRLNALWDGVPDELGAWLDMNPRAMTAQAVLHLRKIPGFETSESAKWLVENYAPPEPVATWTGLDEGFESWVTSYAAFASRVFFRRESLSTDGDPATPFARWLKDNVSVLFNHPERGYRHVAKTIQEALGRQRMVLVVMMDALAIQLGSLAIDYLRDSLGAQPARVNFVFAPLPTVTQVCKEAILTGQFPSDCQGNLLHALLRTYRLNAEQVRLAANWQDAERLHISAKTRLVVYRDNRIDDQLKTAGTYKVLVEECPAVLSRVARLVERWVSDLRHLNDSPPLVLLTSDHGFTFGPPPASEARSRRTSDGRHRCVEVSDAVTQSDLADESLTFIDKNVFHLHNNYLAARGRYFGKGTASGWALSHGGLLPEEVIVPVAEWFGDEASVLWPEVSFPDGASRDQDRWIASVAMRNPHPVPLFRIGARFSLSGQGHAAVHPVPRLGPNETTEFPIQIRSASLPEGETLAIDVRMSVDSGERGTQQERIRQYAVPKKKQFVIRTTEQAAFEDMF
jgi:hypothetical protein